METCAATSLILHRVVLRRHVRTSDCVGPRVVMARTSDDHACLIRGETSCRAAQGQLPRGPIGPSARQHRPPALSGLRSPRTSHATAPPAPCAGSPGTLALYVHQRDRPTTNPHRPIIHCRGKYQTPLEIPLGAAELRKACRVDGNCTLTALAHAPRSPTASVPPWVAMIRAANSRPEWRSDDVRPAWATGEYGPSSRTMMTAWASRRYTTSSIAEAALHRA